MGGTSARVYVKIREKQGKVGIFTPVFCCPVLMSKQSWFAGMVMSPKTQRTVQGLCCNIKNPLKSAHTPPAAEGGGLHKVFRVNGDFMQSQDPKES